MEIFEIQRSRYSGSCVPEKIQTGSRELIGMSLQLHALQFREAPKRIRSALFEWYNAAPKTHIIRFYTRNVDVLDVRRFPLN